MNNSILGWIYTLRKTYKNWFSDGLLIVFRSDSFKIKLREIEQKYDWKRIQVLNH